MWKVSQNIQKTPSIDQDLSLMEISPWEFLFKSLTKPSDIHMHTFMQSKKETTDTCWRMFRNSGICQWYCFVMSCNDLHNMHKYEWCQTIQCCSKWSRFKPNGNFSMRISIQILNETIRYPYAYIHAIQKRNNGYLLANVSQFRHMPMILFRYVM